MNLMIADPPKRQAPTDTHPTGRAGDTDDSIVCKHCNGECWVPSAEKRELFVLWLRHLADFLRGCGGFQFG
jgi:hypothetical protein